MSIHAGSAVQGVRKITRRCLIQAGSNPRGQIPGRQISCIMPVGGDSANITKS